MSLGIRKAVAPVLALSAPEANPPPDTRWLGGLVFTLRFHLCSLWGRRERASSSRKDLEGSPGSLFKFSRKVNSFELSSVKITSVTIYVFYWSHRFRDITR